MYTNDTNEDANSARVAYELMMHIAEQEKEEQGAYQNSRGYWLELYSQCRQETQMP